MLDTVLRPLINAPLENSGRFLARKGISANSVTLVGLLAGLLAALAIALGLFSLGLLLIVANRVLDGLDGAVARASHTTDSGGYLDIVVDYAFYGSVPLAFAIAEPASNAVAAAALLAAFCLTAASFLAFATIAAKRGIETTAHGRKAFFYSTGIVEGSETILCFLLMTALPDWFVPLAWGFSALCIATVLQRTVLACKLFGDNTKGQ